ncbi:MAG: helix-turn-helix domain-containing protein [Lachnospirales bacterium]
MSSPLLSAKLVELRKERGISQIKIANYLGVTREAYSHYERNTRQPSLEIIMKITYYYDIEVNELINENTVPVVAGSNRDFERNKFAKNVENKKNITLSENMEHFLKIFSGKNNSIDLTNITKDDIIFLKDFKKLDYDVQIEVMDFMKFKQRKRKKV